MEEVIAERESDNTLLRNIDLRLQGWMTKSPPASKLKTRSDWLRRYFTLLQVHSEESYHTIQQASQKKCDKHIPKSCKYCLVYWENEVKANMKPIRIIPLTKECYISKHIDVNWDRCFHFMIKLTTPKRNYIFCCDDQDSYDSWSTALKYAVQDSRESPVYQTLNETKSELQTRRDSGFSDASTMSICSTKTLYENRTSAGFENLQRFDSNASSDVFIYNDMMMVTEASLDNKESRNSVDCEDKRIEPSYSSEEEEEEEQDNDEEIYTKMNGSFILGDPINLTTNGWNPSNIQEEEEEEEESPYTCMNNSVNGEVKGDVSITSSRGNVTYRKGKGRSSSNNEDNDHEHYSFIPCRRSIPSSTSTPNHKQIYSEIHQNRRHTHDTVFIPPQIIASANFPPLNTPPVLPPRSPRMCHSPKPPWHVMLPRPDMNYICSSNGSTTPVSNRSSLGNFEEDCPSDSWYASVPFNNNQPNHNLGKEELESNHEDYYVDMDELKHKLSNEAKNRAEDDASDSDVDSVKIQLLKVTDRRPTGIIRRTRSDGVVRSSSIKNDNNDNYDVPPSKSSSELQINVYEEIGNNKSTKLADKPMRRNSRGNSTFILRSTRSNSGNDSTMPPYNNDGILISDCQTQITEKENEELLEGQLKSSSEKRVDQLSTSSNTTNELVTLKDISCDPFAI